MLKKTAILFQTLALFCLATSNVKAQVDIGQQFGSNYNSSADLGKLVTSLSSNAVVLGGVLFLIAVIGAGYHMLHNSGDAQKFAQGRDIITYAFFGFLIIFGAYWIIQIIETTLGIQILR